MPSPSSVVISALGHGADRRDARPDGLAVDDDGAGAALAEAAAELRAAQLEIVAEDVEQRRGGIDVHLLRASVYLQRQDAHGRKDTSLTGSPGSGIGIRDSGFEGSGSVPSLLAGDDALLDLGERGDDDVADDLQAARADGVEVVLRRVPGRVVEVDDVDRGDAGLQERQVVVFDGRSARSRTCRRGPACAPRAQMMSVEPAAWSSRRAGWCRSRSPIMSSRTSALQRSSSDPAFCAAST